MLLTMHRVESFRDALLNVASDRTSVTTLLRYICKQMKCIMGLKLKTLAENSVICLLPSAKDCKMLENEFILLHPLWLNSTGVILSARRRL